MLTIRSRIQVLAFVVVAVLGITYLGVRYVGITRWFGGGGYTVHVELASGGGLFPDGEVTYRGVTVGRVGDMQLRGNGIEVTLDITSDDRIPSDVQAVVADRSVIGEQYLDLRPRRGSGPFLHDGSVIARSSTQLPPPVQDLLLSTDRFAASVPVGALQTVVNQLYLATDGAAQNLQTLIATSRSFFAAADRSLPETLDLIGSARTVLATQQRTSASIRAFSAGLDSIGQQLRKSNGDVSAVLRRADPALTQADDLLDGISTPLHGLLTNLFATSKVFLADDGGLRQVLADLPVAVTDAGAVITPDGINVGLVPTFFSPLPCTAGYGGTHVRSGLSTSGNPPLNTAASCQAPPGSATDLHGTQHARGAR